MTATLPDLAQREREDLLRAGHLLSEHAPAVLLAELLEWTGCGAREVADLARLAPAAELWMRVIRHLGAGLPAPVYRALVAVVLQLILCERLATLGALVEGAFIRSWSAGERRERLLEAVAAAEAAVRCWERDEL